eukprot:Opistho-1_new@62242
MLTCGHVMTDVSRSIFDFCHNDRRMGTCVDMFDEEDLIAWPGSAEIISSCMLDVAIVRIEGQPRPQPGNTFDVLYFPAATSLRTPVIHPSETVAATVRETNNRPVIPDITRSVDWAHGGLDSRGRP